MVNKDHKAFLKRAKANIFPDAPEPEQVAEFFEAIGVALSTWQLVEEALFLLYERAVEPNRPGAAGCGFHALQFMGKLLVTDAAVRFALLGASKKDAPALIDAWDNLFKKARSKSTSRNHFAHFTVFSYLLKKKKSDRVRLEPSVYDYRYAAGLVAKKKYTLNDIRNHATAFDNMAVELRAFLSKIPPQKKPQPASP